MEENYNRKSKKILYKNTVPEFVKNIQSTAFFSQGKSYLLLFVC